MSESPKHLELVRRIRDVLKTRDDIDANLVIAEDHEENTITFQTPEGYRPDVYYYDNKKLILGEAKTTKDLNNNHSNSQFESYINYCNAMSSLVEVSIYIGVPWGDFRQVKKYFKKRKNDAVKVIVINDFGLSEEI